MNEPLSACHVTVNAERIERLRALVQSWARAWCRGAEDEADDLTQDVMVRVLSRLHQFRGEAKLTSWTYAVARSVFVSQARKVARRARSEGLYASSATTWSTGPAADVGDGLSPGDVVRWLKALTAKGVLSEAERDAFELVVLGDMNATQAGEHLGIAPASVRARLCRAARRIRSWAMVEALIVFGVVWASSGCAPGGQTSLTTTRDSAGVTIVESAGPSWTPETAWTVDSVPLLDLGRTGTGPVHEFYRVVDVTFVVDGGIVVANRGSAQVRFYDGQGRFTAALGAEGDGPGEFRRLSGVARYAGDSLVAFDPSARRATVIGAKGTPGRVVTFDLPENMNTTPVVDALYVPDSGGFFLSATVMPAAWPPRGRQRIPQLVLAMSPTGVVQDTVAGMSGFEQFGGSEGITTPPLDRRSHGAEHRDELYLCEGERPEYTAFTRDGTLKRIVRVPTLSLGVPEHVLDSIRDDLSTGSDLSREMVEGLPPTYPSCSGLLVDALGYVWLERYHPSSGTSPFGMSPEPRVWLVFSPAGEWLGELELPANFEVFEVEESRILGLARDSLEVETVQVLGLRRR